MYSCENLMIVDNDEAYKSFEESVSTYQDLKAPVIADMREGMAANRAMVRGLLMASKAPRGFNKKTRAIITAECLRLRKESTELLREIQKVRNDDYYFYAEYC